MANTAKELDILKTGSGLTTGQLQKFFTATPKDKVQTRPAKGGGQWKYVSGSYVTQVLNSLFGFDWSFTVDTSMADALATARTGTVVVKGRLTVRIGEKEITKEQYGRKEVAFKKDTQDPLDFGNDMKAAATDAKKKCASELGLFADVYSQEDFFEVKIVDQDSEAPQTEDLLDQFKSARTESQITQLLKTLDPAGRRAFTQVAENRLREIRNANDS